MSRVQAQLKIHELHGPRLPYDPRLAEIKENEYVHLTADGIAVLDGEGILYWVDTIVTTDAGGSRVYDNNAASGNSLSAAYAAKKDDGQLRSWDPPKIYKHGIYVDLSNSEVEICYKPLARNLRCTVAVAYAPGIKNLVSRITTRKESTKDLVTRLVSRKVTSRALVSQVAVEAVTWNQTEDLVSRVTVRQNTSTALVSRVTVVYIGGTSNVVSRVVVRKVTSKSLVCHLYADRTE